MPIERIGDAFEFDDRLTVVGARLTPGDPAPDFALERFDPTAGAMTTVRLADSAGSIRLLNIINSIDTPVCHIETRRWDSLRGDLPPDAVLYTVSMDLPYALARWLGSEQVSHQALSAHKDETFGIAYGVLVKEWRMLQRAVVIIDATDRIAYVEYVADQMREPDYAAAVAALHRAQGNGG